MLTTPQHLQALALVVAEQRLTIDQLQQQLMQARQQLAEAETGSAELRAERETVRRMRDDLVATVRAALDGKPFPPLTSLTPAQLDELLRAGG